MGILKCQIKQLEFSKIIICAVMLTYFVGVFVGTIVVLKEPMQIRDYFIYIGGPSTTALGFYYWKAKFENGIKIGMDKEEVFKILEEQNTQQKTGGIEYEPNNTGDYPDNR